MQDQPNTSATAEEPNRGLERSTELYEGIFNPNRTGNPVRGKSFRDLTAEDFRSIPRDLDGLVILPIILYGTERYDLIDRIRPTAMSRDEFFHVMLRENAYRNTLGVALNNSEYVPNEVSERPITVTRPVNRDGTVVDTTVQIPAGDIAFRDAATDILANGRLQVVEMHADVLRQTLPPDIVRSTAEINTETSAMILGVFAGTNPNFLTADSALPLSAYYPKSKAETQTAVCAALPAITEPGRPRGMNQNMALSAGLLLGRQYSNERYENLSTDYGVLGDICPSTAPVWNHETMGAAITSEEITARINREAAAAR